MINKENHINVLYNSWIHVRYSYAYMYIMHKTVCKIFIIAKPIYYLKQYSEINILI